VAQVQLDQARLNLSYAKITAPVAGIIGKKSVEVGQRVQPGEQLFIITQTGDTWITANFKETQLRRIHPGQRVTIEIDAFDKNIEGYVDSLAGATGARYSVLPPENATGNYVKVVQRLPVRLRFNKDQPGVDLLRPGMSVEPKVWIK
jgi:membrane fusion protein (multidrug efflux system)